MFMRPSVATIEVKTLSKMRQSMSSKLSVSFEQSKKVTAQNSAFNTTVKSGFKLPEPPTHE